MDLLKIRERIYRYVVYFRRGHGSWLAYIISFANFAVIQYRLLVQYIPFLESLLPSLTAFIVTFFFVYVPVATIIGWYDIKKATVPKEAEVNPYFYRPTRKEVNVYYPIRDTILEALEKIAEKEGLNDEVKRIREVREIYKRMKERANNPSIE